MWVLYVLYLFVLIPFILGHPVRSVRLQRFEGWNCGGDRRSSPEGEEGELDEFSHSYPISLITLVAKWLIQLGSMQILPFNVIHRDSKWVLISLL